MVGLILLFSLFLINIAFIVTEKRKKCVMERKFWISVFFLVVLIGFTLYGFGYPVLPPKYFPPG